VKALLRRESKPRERTGEYEMKPIKHAKNCEYICSGHDLWMDCTCSAKSCGKPFRHWQEMARDHVVDAILREALLHTDNMSVPGVLARAKLLGMVSDLDSDRVERILGERNAMQENFVHLFNKMLDSRPELREAFGFPKPA
jgi:hypothetical protein